MKLTIIACAVVFVFSAEGAMAACSPPAASQVKDNALTTLLSGNTVCAVRGNDRWQEEHHAGGVLKDYKKGPSDKVDPTKTLGSWAVSGNGANTNVIYTYTGGGSFLFTVWDNGGGSYSFCKGGTPDLDFTLRPGTGRGC